MDIWEIVMIILGVIIISYLINYCCGSKQRQGRILGAPVVVTTTTTAGGYPSTIGATATDSYQVTPYPATTSYPTSGINPPYPTHPGVQPMPQATLAQFVAPVPGFQPHTAPPYPPSPSTLANQNPPSYEQAVGAELSSKQAPYNPNYMGN